MLYQNTLQLICVVSLKMQAETVYKNFSVEKLYCEKRHEYQDLKIVNVSYKTLSLHYSWIRRFYDSCLIKTSFASKFKFHSNIA